MNHEAGSLCQLRAAQSGAAEWILLPCHQMLYLAVGRGAVWVLPRWGERAREAEGPVKQSFHRHSSVCLAPLFLLLELIWSRYVAMFTNLRGKTFEKTSGSSLSQE